ncbi:MAG: WD40 repeat domain-containing protein [Planctomycetales bacterium]|nr:WD40 repeat domain-containing protein [Planctomycetales bacterium]
MTAFLTLGRRNWGSKVFLGCMIASWLSTWGAAQSVPALPQLSWTAENSVSASAPPTNASSVEATFATSLESERPAMGHLGLPSETKSEGHSLYPEARLNASLIQGGIESIEVQLEPLDDATSPPVITALAATSDGRFIAAAGDDHAIRIIDALTGEVQKTILGHIDWIHALTFSADGRVLYSSGDDGRILSWRYDHPLVPEEILKVPYAVRSLSVTSHRGLLAVSGFDNEILLMDLTTRLLKYRFEPTCGEQRCVKFSPQGKHLLCAGRDGSIRVWNVDSFEELANYDAHVGRVHNASFSADETIVTSVGEDRRLVRANLSTGKIESQETVGMSKLMSLCLINDRIAAVAGADSLIRIVDLEEARMLLELQGHTGTVASLVACGNALVSGSFDTTVRIWKISSAKGRSEVSLPISTTDFSFDSNLQIR